MRLIAMRYFRVCMIFLIILQKNLVLSVFCAIIRVEACRAHGVDHRAKYKQCQVLIKKEKLN